MDPHSSLLVAEHIAVAKKEHAFLYAEFIRAEATMRDARQAYALKVAESGECDPVLVTYIPTQEILHSMRKNLAILSGVLCQFDEVVNNLRAARDISAENQAIFNVRSRPQNNKSDEDVPRFKSVD